MPGSIFPDYFPFRLLKTNRIHGCRNLAGTLDYDIYLNQASLLPVKVIAGVVQGNRWLDQLRVGQNPAAKYLLDQYRYLLSQANVGEKVSLATKDHPMRWCGAGGLLIIQNQQGQRFVPLNLRPTFAFYGNHLDAQGGLSSSLIHWLMPKILGLQEIFEELILVEGSQLLIPQIGHFNQLLKLEPLIDVHLNIMKTMLKHSHSRLKKLPLKEITPPKSLDFLKIHFLSPTITPTTINRGIVIVDHLTGALDLRNIYKVNIPDVNKILIIDGETDLKNPAVSRDRPIFLFKLEDLLEAFTHSVALIKPVKVFQRGQLIKSQSLRVIINNQSKLKARYQNGVYLTPVLASMLKALLTV